MTSKPLLLLTPLEPSILRGAGGTARGHWHLETKLAIRDWNHLREVALHGYDDGIICLASIECIQRSNIDAVIASINLRGAGYAAALLIQSTLFRLHMYTVRAYDDSKRPDDQNLCAAIKFVEINLRDERDSQRRSDLQSAILLFNQSKTDNRLARLRHIRNKLMAHVARPDPTLRKLTYDELFDFTKITTKIWERLSFGAGTILVPIDHQIDIYRESADSFWGMWGDAVATDN